MKKDPLERAFKKGNKNVACVFLPFRGVTYYVKPRISKSRIKQLLKQGNKESLN